MAGAINFIQGISRNIGGAGKWAERTFGTNLGEIRAMLQKGYKTGTLGRRVSRFFGFGVDVANPYDVYGALGISGGAHMASLAGRIGPGAAGRMKKALSYSTEVFGARQAALYAGVGAGVLGVSMATGISVGDIAQAGVAGYHAYKFVRGQGFQGAFGMKPGAGRFTRGVYGTAAALTVGAAAIGGGYMSAGSWMWAGAGYGAVRGAQYFSGYKLGGGWARAGGFAGGLGAHALAGWLL